MKNQTTVVAAVAVLCLVLLGSSSSAQTVQGGLFAQGGTTLEVLARPTGGTISGSFTACTVTIFWPTSAGVTLGSPSSAYGFAASGGVGTDGASSYQIFAFFNPTGGAISWGDGTEHSLFTVPVSGGTGLTTFEVKNSGGVFGEEF